MGMGMISTQSPWRANSTRPMIESPQVRALSTVTVRAKVCKQRARSIRTLDLFLTAKGGRLPAGFVITLPKNTVPAQVAALASLLEALEAKLAIAQGTIGIELMIETPHLFWFCVEEPIFEVRKLTCIGSHLEASYS